jgi:hypothetical protein
MPAPGMRRALNSTALKPSGGDSTPPRPNWFVVSTTTLPPSGPITDRAASIVTHGTAKTTTSAKATASAGVPARAPGTLAAKLSSLPASREKLKTTSWPDLASCKPALPPILPAPTTPTRIRFSFSLLIRKVT